MKRYISITVVLILSVLLNGCNKESDIAIEEGEPNYAQGIIHKTTKVLDDTYLIAHYYGEVGSEEEGMHVLLLNNDTEDIDVGDTIVFGKTEEFPHGLIKKVHEVIDAEDHLKVLTQQATLGDVFQELNISHTQRLQPSQVLENGEKSIRSDEAIHTLYALEGVALHPLYQEESKSAGMDFTVDFEEVDLGHGVTIDGSMDFSLDFSMKVTLRTVCTNHVLGVCDAWKTELGHTYFYIEPREEGQVTLSASDTLSYTKEKILAEYEFEAIEIPVGVVPVVVVPKLKFVAGLDGKVTAGISMGFDEELSFKVGVTHKKKTHHSAYKWYKIASIQHHFNVIPPYFDANADAKVYTGPALELLIYDVAGPDAMLNTSLEAEVDLLNNPWWSLYYGIESDAGFTLDVFGHDFADVRFKVFDYQKELAKADGPFE